MSKTITTTLDSRSLHNAANQIRAYKHELRKKLDGLITELALEGASIARVIVMNEAYDTGALMNSIEGFFDPVSRTGFIQAGKGLEVSGEGTKYGNYAFYVEFGTGIVGEESPHPLSEDSGWDYDVHGHGEGGWFYKAKGKTHWTKGQPARPFMFETAMELERLARQLAKERFRA